MGESTPESRALVVRANKRWLDEAWFHAEVEMAVLVTNPPEHLLGTVRLAAAVALTIRDDQQDEPAEPVELRPSCTTCGRWEADHGSDHPFAPGREVCAWSSGHATSDGYIPPPCPGCPHG